MRGKKNTKPKTGQMQVIEENCDVVAETRIVTSMELADLTNENRKMFAMIELLKTELREIAQDRKRYTKKKSLASSAPLSSSSSSSFSSPSQGSPNNIHAVKKM